MTIHEALSCGLPVIAWQRGCIESVLDRGTGLVIKQKDDFVRLTIERILLWASSVAEYRCASETAYKRFLFLRAHNQKKIHFLFKKMFIGDDRFSNFQENELAGG